MLDDGIAYGSSEGVLSRGGAARGLSQRTGVRLKTANRWVQRAMPRSAKIRRRMSTGGIVSSLLLMALYCVRLPALNTSQAEYTRRVWHIQDGLPEDTIQAMQQTPDGYLWIGTTGGLARFDGSRFLTYSHATYPALTENSIFCIFAAKDGTLWLGTEGGGLLHFDHGNFQSYAAGQGLTDGFVRSVLEDSRGRIWVGTDNGLFRIVRGAAQPVDTSRFGAPFPVHSIFEDQQHRIWVGGARLLAFENDVPRQYPLPGAYSQNKVKSILQTKDGTVWVGTVGGLDRLEGERFAAVPGIAATVRVLRQTSDGALWIGTIGQGLFTFNHDELNRVNGSDLLPSNTVLSIYEDDTHQVWVGTQDGMVRLSRTPVSVVPLPGGSDPDFETISADTDGTIWAVASQVFAIRGGVARPYTFDGIPAVPVRNVFRDREGTMWIGTDGSGAYHLTAHGAVHYSAPRQLVNNFVRAFLESRDGAMWIATDEGVSRIVTEHIQNYRVADGLAYFSTRALMEDSEGSIWIGTDHGLSCWRNGRFIANDATRLLSQDKVWSILQDKGGTLWFGTRDHGLFRYRGNKLTEYTTAQGLVSNSIYQLLADTQGRLWLSGPNSISSFNLSDLPANAKRNAIHLAVTTYTLPYAADGAEMYGGRQPSGCMGKDGGVWFPSNKGAVHVLPEPLVRFAPSRLFITTVVSDGRELTPESSFSLAADSSRLEIGFAPLLLRSQEGVQFRYMLEPFDVGWTYAGANRMATYTNLPAGKYRFRVAAFAVDDPSVTSEVTLDFRKAPHFYATWWFLTACVLALSLMVWIVYRSRMRLLQVRFHAVLDERSRLAREMHDTVIQGCTSISALLEAISSLERENQVLHQDLLDHARTQVRTTINEARHAVWNLRHSDEPEQELGQAVANIAENTRKEFAIEVECRGEGRPFAVRSSLAHEVLMIIREAVYNAAMHGKPRRILVDLIYSGDELAISVTDDGVGFDPATTSADMETHYGIAGMKERAAGMNGRFQLTSAPGKGTAVQVRIRRNLLISAAAGEKIEI